MVPGIRPLPRHGQTYGPGIPRHLRPIPDHVRRSHPVRPARAMGQGRRPPHRCRRSPHGPQLAQSRQPALNCRLQICLRASGFHGQPAARQRLGMPLRKLSRPPLFRCTKRSRKERICFTVKTSNFNRIIPLTPILFCEILPPMKGRCDVYRNAGLGSKSRGAGVLASCFQPGGASVPASLPQFDVQSSMLNVRCFHSLSWNFIPQIPVFALLSPKITRLNPRQPALTRLNLHKKIKINSTKPPANLPLGFLWVFGSLGSWVFKNGAEFLTKAVPKPP